MKIDLKSEVIDDTLAIIDDRLAYSTKEMAIEAAKDIGCDSFHEHEYEGQTWYMPCKEHKLHQRKNLKNINALKGIEKIGKNINVLKLVQII